MQPYMNEDAAWLRLKDLQLEAENHRLAAMANESGSSRGGLRGWAERAWFLAGLAMRRAPRHKPRSA
ncbi:MAG TPA: hypothetical protein VGK42_09510 [Candidatus Dormibacteraeota bacterium]